MNQRMKNTRLRVELLPDWRDISLENLGGPPSFVRDSSDESGALQISIQALFAGGKTPDSSHEHLIRLAEGVALNTPDAKLRGRSSGVCSLGQYGTVLASRQDYSWFQVWVLSNGKDFVLATHISVDEPDEEEVNEASWIVKNSTIVK